MTQSSYLMSFIHGLLENSSKEVRERKRRLLERDYSETEEVLNVYLNEKYNDVTQILNVYRDVSQSLEKNRKAVQKMKRDITQCKSLLSCNRDELRRLWLELVEQRRALELIEILDRVKSAPENLKNLIAAKAWPEATEYAIAISEIVSKEVDHVPALDAVKAELAAKKKLLVSELKATLFFLVFKQPIALLISGKDGQNTAITETVQSQMLLNKTPDHQSNSNHYVAAFEDLPLSDWRTFSTGSPDVDSNLLKDPLSVVGNIAKRQAAIRSFLPANGTKSRTDGGVSWTKEVADRLIKDKKQWGETVVALTHCLHRLQKLSQGVFAWRGKAEREDRDDSGVGTGSFRSSRSNSDNLTLERLLVAEVHKYITLPAVAEIERIIAAQGESARASTLADPTYLVELLQLLFPALCMHFNAFMLVLNTARKIKAQNPALVFDFLDVINEEQIWSYIQLEVQTVLSIHLSQQKISNGLNSLTMASNFDTSKLDLVTLMGKKRSAMTAFISSVTGDSSSLSGSHSVFMTDDFSSSSSNEPFFSFSKTAHSLSLNSYFRENRISMPLEMQGDSKDGGGGGGGGVVDGSDEDAAYLTVCRPSVDNVKSVYSLVIAFARLIESQPVSSANAVQRAISAEEESERTGQEPPLLPGLPSSPSAAAGTKRPPAPLPPHGGRSGFASTAIPHGLKGAILAIGAQRILPAKLQVRCQLRSFLINFIERLYLPNAEVELRQPLVVAVSNHDALTNVVSQQIQRAIGLQRPILTVAYLTNQGLGETKGMAIALPDYASNCAKIGLSILETFLSWASSTYKSISITGSKEVAIPSAEWARDKDLSRFWTTFPVWQRMMAADTFVMEASVHSVGGPQQQHPLGGARSGRRSTFADLRQPGPGPSSQLSCAAAIVLGLSNLGLNGRSDPTFRGGPSLQALPFANYVGQEESVGEGGVPERKSTVGSLGANGRLSREENILLHERETTRLAGKEMDNLLHIIRDELGSSLESSLPTAGMHTIKSLGRLRQSVHWLEHCVQSWLSWLESSSGARNGGASAETLSRVGAVAEELTSLSNATLLAVYLDVRVDAFNALGNLHRTATFWCPVDEVDVDPEVTRCLLYWDQLQESLVHAFCPHEIRFIFDGLGDFISQIFLRLIPQISRMNVNGNRKMCRNIYKLQQALALLTENHESDLIRVKQLYELFYLNPEAVVNRVIEQGVAFEVGVYQNLLRLYQRSHPSYDHARTDDSITKLAQIIRV